MTIDRQLIFSFYQAGYAKDFARINYYWLKKYDLLEDGDLKYLEHPQEYILDKGGQVIFLLDGKEVIGTCAVLPHSAEIIEIAKFAIIPEAQGSGLGKLLVKYVIENYAQKNHYKKIILVSSTKLESALKLYEKVGFKYKELPNDVEYDTADIYMELDLSDDPLNESI